jgi:competence protein ComEC
VGLALAFAAGAALPLAGLPLFTALLPPLLPLLPIRPLRRPRWPLSVALLAGALGADGALRTLARDCRHALPEEGSFRIEGRFEGRPGAGAAPFRVERGLPGGCTGTLRVVLREGVLPPTPGAALRVEGRWRRGGDPDPRAPERAGTLTALTLVSLPDSALRSAPILRLRGRVQEAIVELYGAQAPLVEALVLARREGLAPEVREAFALSGTAHLLAISGFHVGVVAGLLLTLFRRLGVRRAGAAGLSALGCWAYVGAIGAPHAAARAATLVTVWALSRQGGRIGGRPVHPAGALASAALLLMLIHPLAPGEIGFQLSFAGCAGLLALRPPMDRRVREWLERGVPARRSGASGGSGVADLVRGGHSGLTSGIAATLATAPLAIWHFGRFPLFGIPATLAIGPVIALAIPGILASLLLHPVFPAGGSFVAGGVAVLLHGVVAAVATVASASWVAPWVTRPTLLLAGAGGFLTALLLRGVPGQRLRPPVRTVVLTAGALLPLVLAPVWSAVHGRTAGELRLTFLDVGQGDAVTVRTPAGRWIVIDTGPRSPGWDAGERVLLPHLRREGARQVELLVLTHPHLDHIGGGEALLRDLPVVRIGDPGHPAARPFYTRLLGVAVEDQVGWWAMRAGEMLEVDGVQLRVLHPVPGADTLAPSHGANAVSVVLELRYGAFRALFTGDAPEEIERLLVHGGEVGPVTLLKAGHHGSRTSTGWELLEKTTPEWAVIPVGRRNSFGHPHPVTLLRLERAGVGVLRTDLHGTITVRVREQGEYRIRTTRGAAPTAPPTLY